MQAEAVAGRLIADFGSLPGVLHGSPARIRRISGTHLAVGGVQHFRAAMTHVLSVDLRDGPLMGNWRSLLDYLQAEMGNARIERVRILHLNTSNRLIRDELVSEGSIDTAQFHVREVIASALELGSAALIIVHNHPSGDPSPSRSDIEVTRALVAAGRTVGIAVHDHLVIGAKGHVSMRSRGLI